jgi:hypothetical protein
MYIRFVLPWRDPDSRVEAGFFRAASDVASAEDRVPEWIRAELWREINWFNAQLPIPRRIVREFRRRRAIHGICWFRPEAGEAINRARYAGWLMTEAGVPVREIRTSRLREVIWRDDYQVVAKPGRGLPVAFH